MTAMARDQGDYPRYNPIDLDIRVVESHKKAPTFTVSPLEPIRLKENFSDYEASIARLEAQSNIDESPDYFLFELVTGRTEQTNKENTFRYARLWITISLLSELTGLRVAPVLPYRFSQLLPV
jgi:hypothetical protein